MTTITTPTTLPLSQLRIDPKANVRHINRGLDPVLLASIKAVGLLTPLSVRPNGKGYLVYAGGQRLLALQEIAKEAETPDMPVPVIITEGNDAASREASLHENVARSAMHPVDEYRAYAQLASDGLLDHEIAQRFGITERQVHQRLALGALDESVLNAWQAGEIDARIAKLFTMQPSKKAQKAALEKARTGYMNEYNVREALGLTSDARAGKLLALVTEAAYIARGGKITRDLFADDNHDNTMISDRALLNAMAGELLDKEVERLKTEGWGTVTKERPDNLWNYPRIEVPVKPTKEETARLKAIEKIFEKAEAADEYLDNNDELEAERDAIQQQIEQRALASIDAKKKAKGIAFVGLSHDQSRIEISFSNPPAKEKSLALGGNDKGKTEKKTAPEDAISQALLKRQAEQLTAAAQEAIVKQPHVAVAVLIACLTASSDAVQITARAHDYRGPKFAAALDAALKMPPGRQAITLAELTAKNMTLFRALMRDPVLADPDFNAVASAIDGKDLTAAMHAKWDAKDYFASVSRSTIVEAVREAMGNDHARKVAAMKKPEAEKFAAANLPKLKWLPKQLRVSGYDGPAAKPKAPAKKAAKPAAKKAKR